MPPAGRPVTNRAPADGREIAAHRQGLGASSLPAVNRRLPPVKTPWTSFCTLVSPRVEPDPRDEPRSAAIVPRSPRESKGLSRDRPEIGEEGWPPPTHPPITPAQEPPLDHPSKRVVAALTSARGDSRQGGRGSMPSSRADSRQGGRSLSSRGDSRQGASRASDRPSSSQQGIQPHPPRSSRPQSQQHRAHPLPPTARWPLREDAAMSAGTGRRTIRPGALWSSFYS